MKKEALEYRFTKENDVNKIFNFEKNSLNY